MFALWILSRTHPRTTRWARSDFTDATRADNGAILGDGNYWFIYGPDGEPLEQVASDGTISYLHTDQLGNVRLLTQTNGATAGTARFSPYGVKTSLIATSPLGFQSQYTDAETGLVYERARMYDPSNGQFLTMDPLVSITGQPYQYVAGDPINDTDPSGTNLASIALGGAEALGGTALCVVRGMTWFK